MKTSADCYSISADGEHGRFFLRQGHDQRDGRGYYWCELTCNTTFGVATHYWGNMGSPAAKFLSSFDTSYLGGKLFGTRATVFDGDEAMRDIRRVLLDDRRSGDCTRDEARERWEQLEYHDPLDNEIALYRLVDSTDWLYEHLVNGGGPLGLVANPQMVGFFRDLWPHFIAELTASEAPAAVEQLTHA